MLGTVFIGRYKVIEELGRGGMGIVYRGEDPVLDRPVAIKVLPPKKLSQKKAVKRFLREAKVSARLDHPYIIKIFDIGEEEGIYHIVMEYISGKTLRDVVEERESITQIDITQMVVLFTQICQAIEYAHNLKIVHRDIKPENIMLTAEGNAKVMDFGLAVLEDRHSLTEVGAVMGTIAYFSPEQARGEPADFRSDIYSLGVMFYEMLTNTLPFEATNPSEMIQKHLTAIPAPPTKRNPSIPPAIEALIQKALRKHPDERYLSVTDMVTELKSYKRTQERSREYEAQKNALHRELKEAFNEQSPLQIALEQRPPQESLRRESTPQKPQAEMPYRAPVVERPHQEIQQHPSRQYLDDQRLYQMKQNLQGEWPLPIPQEVDDSHVQEDYDEDDENDENLAIPKHLIPPREVDATPQEVKSFPPFQQPASQSSPLASPQWMMEAKDEAEQDRYVHFMEKLKKDASVRSHATEADGMAPPSAVVCAKCGLENPGDKKYCIECGNLLAPSFFIASKEASYHNDKGVMYFEDGDYGRALIEFQQALARDPDMTEARFNIARAFLELGELDRSLEEFRSLSVLEPDNPQPYLYIADIYRKQDRKDLAVSEYIKAIKLNPNDAQVRCQLAFLYSQQGFLPQAINEYRSALLVDNENMEAHQQLGFIFAGLEQIEEAIREFEWVIKLDPGNQQAFKWLGTLYSKRKRYSQAEKAYTMALSINPADAGIHAQLGDIYEKQNKEEMAFQTLFRAVSIDQGNIDARAQLAQMYLKHNQPHMAVKELEAIVTHHPRDVVVHQQLGELYLKLNRVDEALDHFEKTVSLAPQSADIHNKLGRLYLKKDYSQLSVLEYQKAVDINPYNPEYREDLGMAYYCQNKNEEAIVELKKAVTLDSRNVDYYKALGIMLEEENRLDEALKVLKKAVEMDPRDPLTHGLLGKVYFRKGLSNMAIYEYQKGLDLQPTNYLLYIYMAKAYSKQDKVDEAIQSFRRAIELMPGSKGAEYEVIMGRAYVDLGKAYLEKGELNLAKEVLETAYKLTPGDAKISHYLGLIWMASRDYRKALEYISQALNIEPNNAEIMSDLGNLFSLRGDTSLAIKAFRRSMELAPDKLENYELLTLALSREGRINEAIEVLGQAMEIDSAHDDHYHWLMGGLFLKAKEPLQALDELLKAVSLNNGDWHYYSDLAVAYRNLNRLEDAARSYEYAIGLCPDKKQAEVLMADMKKLKVR